MFWYSLEAFGEALLMGTHNVCFYRQVRKVVTLRKHACSNILKIFLPKNENFQIENSDIFHISVQNIDCGYLLEPP